jgi:hypothetical protein
MSIPFEDLPIKQFISKLKALGDYTISAQADGLSFYFGIDEDGSFYTSAYSPDKRTKFAYKLSDYPLRVENNQYRAAHVALSKYDSEISSILENGQAIECQLEANAETQFGGTYNKIIIIRPVTGESTIAKSQVIDNLYDKLGSTKITVKCKQLLSIDGEELSTQDTITHWKVSKSKSDKGTMLTSSKLESLLHKLEGFLSQTNQVAKDHGLEMTNMDIASANLTKIPVNIRPVIESERTKLNKAILNKYKFPIKSELIAKLESEFGTQAGLIHKGSDSVWLSSNEFSANGKFDTIPKRELKGFLRTTDKNASLEDRGGIEGIANQRIADLFGMPELIHYSSAKKVFKNLRGSNPRETARNFANQLGKMDFYGVRLKIGTIFDYSRQLASKKLEKFKAESSDFKHVTSSGESEGYSPEDIKLNLGYFAQTIEGFEDKINELKRCKDFTDIVLMLYEPIINSLHGKHITESILEESIKHPSLEQVSHLTAEDICAAYTATLIASQLLLRAKYKQVATLLKDQAHANLKTYKEHGMSPLNFWGMVVFSPFIASMKGQMQAHVVSDLKKLSGRITITRIHNIHKTLSTGSLIQDWDLQEENAKLVAMRLETRGQAINMAITGIRHWDDITLSDKNTIIAKVFYYLQRHVPNSPLLVHVRHLANETLTNAAKEDNLKKEPLQDVEESLLQQLSRKVLEAEMGTESMLGALAGGASVAAFADMGTQMDPSNAGNTIKKQLKGPANVSPTNQLMKFMNGKPIIRRKRDFVKRPDFERPGSEDRIQEDEATSVDPGTISSSSIATFPDRLFDQSSKKKKKATIKRIVPFYKHVKTAYDNMFKDLSESQCSVVLEWNDEDYSGKPETDEGFRYLKQSFGIVATVVESTGKWPTVKLIGERNRLSKFLLEVYGASDDFIATQIHPLMES